MTRLLATVAACAIAVFSVLHAAPAPAQNANAQLLTLSCSGCHGANGHSPGQMPPLFGRSADMIAQALREFRADQRPATVMNRIAKGYTDAEIDAVAREIATTWR